MCLFNLQVIFKGVDKLGKFGGLLKNEYIKTLKRTSTFIMVIIVILSSIGISVLAVTVKKSMRNYMYHETELSYEITDLEQNKPEGYEDEVKFLKYLQEKKYDYSDYRYILAQKLHEKFSGDELYQYLDKIDGDSQWKVVCQALLDKSETETEKWEYKYRLDNDIPFSNVEKNLLIEKVNNAKINLEGASEEDKGSLNKIKEEIEVSMYMLDNNIDINVADNESLFEAHDESQINFWRVFCQSASLVSIIGLLIIVIAGNSVASEFSQGTIKFLLINPVKRWKILVSKYITVISIGYIMLAILYLFTILSAGVAMGFDKMDAQYIYYSDGAVQTMSGFLFVVKKYLFNSVSIVLMASLAFAISSLFKSAALSIGISVFSMMAGNTIVQVLVMLKQDWARYLLFSNMNLATIVEGKPLFPHQTLSFSIIVLVLHMAVFLLTAWDGFTKKEV